MSCCPLINLLNVIPSPSIKARSTPPARAEREEARRPWRTWRSPPVAAPATMEFQGSSF
ncbi:hypothetical protein RHMOL_Rhmol05G0040200 [Rhododendron molle]|uniref:Uncharacterized protein n=1 Tax=Rhododendron molle TaxID=49168 RepID=A0ACC0NLI0_RHOML|nr:hypothetical protein RHMOL_Rhmol05G0040200 [Rhododendron molle]